MTVEAGKILDQYLNAVEVELRDLSPSDRAEIILELREHFEESRRELADPGEAELRNIVERLGPPTEIAAEARQRLGASSAPNNMPSGPTPPVWRAAAGWLEILALVGWIGWWPLGVLLTALSPRWTRRDRVIALVVQFGFFAVVSAYLETPVYLTGGSFGFPHAVKMFVFLLLPPTVIGLVGATYLAWRLLNPVRHQWSKPWKVAGRTAAVVLSAWLLWALLLGPLAAVVMTVHAG